MTSNERPPNYILRPKLQSSLERLINKYESIMTEHHVQGINNLVALLEQVCEEGNDFLVLKEYCGYLVMVWRML